MDCPWQMERLPVMAQTGSGFADTVWLQVLLQPFAAVTVRKYVPAVLTVIQLVVAPVLHK